MIASSPPPVSFIASISAGFHGILLIVTALGKGITKKPPPLAFAVGIAADKIVRAGAAAVERYQVETRNRFFVAVTDDAEHASALAPPVEGDKIVCRSILAAIKWHRGALLWTFVEMS
jgi:hypothetical protein